VFVAAALLIACSPKRPPELHASESESIWIPDPSAREEFKQGLATKNIPFAVRTVDGKELVVFGRMKPDELAAIETQFKEYLPPDHGISFDSQTQQEFKEWLTSNGIPFRTSNSNGQEFVHWNSDLDAKVFMWPKMPKEAFDRDKVVLPQ
jgi:hypothetical protein